MKKENKIRKAINNTSFQAQLFLIVLLSFILFVVVEYLLVQYAFSDRYVRNETQRTTQEVDKLSESINNGGVTSLLSSLKKYNDESGAIPLVVSNKTGSYILVDSSYGNYKIECEYNEKLYLIDVYSYELNLKVGDTITAYLTESVVKDEYIAKMIEVNNEKFENGIWGTENIILENARIINVYKPQNINFLFEGNEATEYALSFLNSNLSDFKKASSPSSVYSSYYLKRDSGYIYLLYKPTLMSGSDYFIFVMSPFIETSSLLSMVSSYYGYVVLASIVIAILIALFISRAFSRPIREIEKDMKELANGSYEAVNHDFKNMEMISLESTLNEVKSDTRKRNENIENQAKSLERLNQELLQQEELRKVFIQRLSHELKTPLMVISATTEALMSDLIPDNEKDKEYNTILDEIDKTTDIIKDIINTYKSTNKEMKLKINRFSLSSLVETTYSTLLPLTQKAKLNVTLNVEPKVFIDADEELIGQVISNFMTNAFKYTNEGERIEINLIDDMEKTRFEVKNYGSFIKEENLEKIWLPFFREQENVESSSTGMGLFIVKTILSSHGYSYDVTNFEGGVISYFESKK